MPAHATGKLLRATLVTAALAVAGCYPGADEEPPINVDAVNEQAARSILAEALSAGLTARDSEGKLVPGLAQSWRVSDDGLSIVFRLRDAEFVGGRKLRSADVVATLQRARRGGSGDVIRDLLQGVMAVNAPLENIVELRLTTPQPEILELLALPQLGIRASRGRETAGAFLIARADEEAETEKPGETAPAAKAEIPETNIRRNLAYFAAEELQYKAATIRTVDPETAIQRFIRGESDITLGGGLDGYNSARVGVRRDELLLEQPRAALLLLLNHKKAPLSHVEVRQALQMAINRQALGQGFFGTEAAAAVRGIVPANIAGYAPPHPEWSTLPFVARQEQARQLLQASGVDPIIERPILTVAIADSAAEARLMETVAADFRELGIELKLARRAPEAHRKAIADGDFDLALVWRDTPIDSPIPFLTPNLCNRNSYGVCVPEADKLVAESWKAKTRAERMHMLAEAERLWMADGAALGLVQPLGWSLVSRRIDGFAANPTGRHALRHLSINPSRRLLQ